VGDSDKSINVGFIASALTSRPGKPVKVSATDAPEITIRWTAPESDGGSAIQKYFVYVDGVYDGESSDLEYTTSLRLTVGQRHKFRVSAVNGVGESTLSEEQEIIAATVPHEPLKPIKQTAAPTWIEFSWAAPLSGGSDIRGYRVYKNGELIIETVDLSAMVTNQIIAGVTYQIRVSAYNDVGESSQSAALSIMAARVPNAPTNVQMSSQSSTAISISWEKPDNGGSPLTSYRIFSDQATDGTTFSEIVPSTGLTITFEIDFGISADFVYRFKVAAVNAVGVSELSVASDPIRAASVPQTPGQPVIIL
jgi:hypothetical protein